MKVIFLDIDGVLNYQDYFLNNLDNRSIKIDKNKLILLKQLVTDTNSDIILTSSWRRLEKDYRQLEELLNKYELRIKDQTKYLSGHRGEEIKEYLSSHKEITHFVILDDEIFKDFDDYLLAHLVKTSFYEFGLEQKHIETSKNLLKY